MCWFCSDGVSSCKQVSHWDDYTSRAYYHNTVHKQWRRIFHPQRRWPILINQFDGYLPEVPLLWEGVSFNFANYIYLDSNVPNGPACIWRIYVSHVLKISFVLCVTCVTVSFHVKCYPCKDWFFKLNLSNTFTPTLLPFKMSIPNSVAGKSDRESRMSGTAIQACMGLNSAWSGARRMLISCLFFTSFQIVHCYGLGTFTPVGWSVSTHKHAKL